MSYLQDKQVEWQVKYWSGKVEGKDASISPVNLSFNTCEQKIQNKYWLNKILLNVRTVRSQMSISLNYDSWHLFQKYLRMCTRNGRYDTLSTKPCMHAWV